MGYGSIVNIFGTPANLDQVADGDMYRRVAGVDYNGQITGSSIGGSAVIGMLKIFVTPHTNTEV